MEIVKKRDVARQWPEENSREEKAFFQDNLEYLEALEHEAKIKLACSLYPGTDFWFF
jgi:hypothetical protein